MKLIPVLSWRLDGHDIDARVPLLLHAIADKGSLSEAVRQVGLSYRHGWGLLGALENTLGAPLVTRDRGLGARLTALGSNLLAAQLRIEAALDPRLLESVEDLAEGAPGSPAPTGRRVVVYASHDLALARLRDQLSAARRCVMELHFHGSLDSLAALGRNQCEIAGFHIPESGAGPALLDQYRPWLKLKSLMVIHFVTRQQGLIVAKKNPLRIHSLPDLVRSRARFVNRQSGSGTRLFFDHLLAAQRIRPAGIDGYALEEFTHAAVAATIASGMADAGFGIEAAARQHRLDFVPIASERYYLAARSSALARPGPAALLEALEGGALSKALHGLPGYAAADDFEARPARTLLA